MHLLTRIKRFLKKLKNNQEKNQVHYFRNPRWRVVTLLERFSGVWPCQSKLAQYSLLTFYLLVYSTGLLVMMNDLRKPKNFDIVTIILSIIFVLLVITLGLKLTLAFAFRSRRLQIYEKIAMHYETITDIDEATVLKEYSNRGFKTTAIFLSVSVIVAALFDCLPNTRMLYEYLFFNGELNLVLPVPLDYGIDHRKYWYCLILHFILCIYSGAIVDAAFDLSFILQVHHVRALFKIVRMRLDKASALVGQVETKKNRKRDNDEKSYSLILSAIDLHKECLEIVTMIEKTYSSTWCILMFINCAVFGAGIHMMSLELHDSIATLRNISSFIILLMHFQIIFTQGQSIIDSSTSIHNACYEFKWYNAPLKSRKLLTFMMTRSTVACKLTGAQFFPLSMEIFTKMLKAGISYYTVFQR